MKLAATATASSGKKQTTRQKIRQVSGKREQGRSDDGSRLGIPWDNQHHKFSMARGQHMCTEL